MGRGIVIVVAALALAAGWPTAASATGQIDSCEVSLDAGTDLTPLGPVGTDGPASCALHYTCFSQTCGLGHIYADVYGNGQVGMRVEETAGGHSWECVGLGHCGDPGAAFVHPSLVVGQDVWVICSLHDYAAQDIHLYCFNSYAF